MSKDRIPTEDKKWVVQGKAISDSEQKQTEEAMSKDKAVDKELDNFNEYCQGECKRNYYCSREMKTSCYITWLKQALTEVRSQVIRDVKKWIKENSYKNGYDYMESPVYRTGYNQGLKDLKKSLEES
jgi:hypothetical protein